MTYKDCDYYRYDLNNNKTIVYNLYLADKLIDIIKEYPEIDTKTYDRFVFDGIIPKDILDSIKFKEDIKMAKKNMVLTFKDDIYFYKFNEQSRINEVLYQIRETINSNFRGLPFVTDISYYLKRDENSYNYVATITYETDEPDEPEPKPTLVLIEKNRKFTMNVKNYNEIFTELKSSIEKQLYREVDKYFSEHPDYTVTKKEAEWTETDESDIFTIVVTYTAPYNAEQEKE